MLYLVLLFHYHPWTVNLCKSITGLCYHKEWKTVPQCLFVVASALRLISQQFSKILLYHYINYILLAADHPVVLQNCFVLLCFFLDKFALCIAADKVPTVPLLKYLRLLLFEQKIVPQPIVLWISIKALNYLQKLLGTISWLTPTLGLSTEALSPSFNLLKKDTDYLLSSQAGCRSLWRIAIHNK